MMSYVWIVLMSQACQHGHVFSKEHTLALVSSGQSLMPRLIRGNYTGCIGTLLGDG